MVESTLIAEPSVESPPKDALKDVSPLDEVKSNAKLLEESIGGSRIKAVNIQALVKAINECEDLPEQYIRGLSLVIASNVVNNYSAPDHKPYAILNALTAKSFDKTLEHFIKALSKLIDFPRKYRFLCRSNLDVVRSWICSLLRQGAKRLHALNELAIESLLLVADITYHLQRPHKCSLMDIVKSLGGVETLLTTLEKRGDAGAADEGRRFCLLSMLLHELARKEEAQIKRSADHHETTQARARLAPVWLNAFNAIYFMRKAFAGEELLLFQNGQCIFKHLTGAQLNETLKEPSKKCFLRVPEGALPALSMIARHAPTIADEFLTHMGDLCQDVFSETNTAYHDHAAAVISRALFYYDAPKQEKVLGQMFGKASKARAQPQYAEQLCKRLDEYYREDASTKTADSLVQHLLTILDAEFKSTKSDSASLPLALILFALSKHLSAETHERFVDIAFAVLKKAPDTFPNCCAYAAGALATLPDTSAAVAKALAATAKELATSAGEVTAPVNYAYFTTILLMRYAHAGTSGPVENLVCSEIFMRESMHNNLSRDALRYGWLFVKSFTQYTNGLSNAQISKMPPLTAGKTWPIARLVSLLIEWPEKLRVPPAHQLEAHLAALNTPMLTRLFEQWTTYINSGTFSDTIMKIADHRRPTYMLEVADVYERSALLHALPAVVAARASALGEGPSAQVDKLLLLAVMLVNNAAVCPAQAAKALTSAFVAKPALSDCLLDAVLTSATIERLHAIEPLKCRQRVIAWLCKLTFADAARRDNTGMIWQQCKSLCAQIDLKALIDVEPNEASIYFTPEGTLYKTSVIVDNSDLLLDERNIRRENKAYKHKDQLEEIKLRKELAARKKHDGVITPKQQEAIKRELAKEKEIRDRLKPIYEPVARLAELLPYIVQNDPNGSLQHYEIFYEYLVPLLKSPIASKAITRCVIVYRDIFFQNAEDFLGERALASLMRAVNAVEVPAEWASEPLVEQISKFVSAINMLSMMNTFYDANAIDMLEQMKDEEQDEATFNEGLTLGKLAFALPVFERVFRDKKLDQRLCRETCEFLKSAFSKDFLTMEEREWPPLELLNKLLLETLCDSEKADFFEDMYELQGTILKLLNAENATSPNVGKYVMAVIEQLRHPNEYVRDHVGRLLINAPAIIDAACVKSADYAHLAVLVTSSHEERSTKSSVGVSAQSICEQLDIKLCPEMHNCLISELAVQHEFWQWSAARALAPLMSIASLDQLRTQYDKLNKKIAATLDRVGRVLSPERDMWPERRGVAIALRHYVTSESYTSAHFEHVLRFAVPDGITDRSASLRNIFTDTATRLISTNGAENIEFVLPLLEEHLNAAADDASGDVLRNGLVCLLGTLARYLEPGSPKLVAIFGRLIEALAVPSRQIQESVAMCLPPLAPMLEDEAVEELSRLMEKLPRMTSYGERCGAAYGIAGLTRGLGLRTLNTINFLPAMAEWFASKDASRREAACLLFLTMCFVHRRAFDPFIAKLLPALIELLGDGNDRVRAAGRDAGAMMMSTLSATGVKMFMPDVLAGLGSTSWRAKCASADFLANISNCAPQQLSESLPKVVPALGDLMTDAHIKVRNTGIDALRQIATVITNPEILAISSYLINAFIEPAKETTRALNVIVNVRFLHFIDPSALALMMPILRRALNDREPEGRRMAANVVTNVFSIADEKDVEPYMAMLVPNVSCAALKLARKTSIFMT